MAGKARLEKKEAREADIALQDFSRELMEYESSPPKLNV